MRWLIVLSAFVLLSIAIISAVYYRHEMSPASVSSTSLSSTIESPFASIRLPTFDGDLSKLDSDIQAYTTFDEWTDLDGFSSVSPPPKRKLCYHQGVLGSCLDKQAIVEALDEAQYAFNFVSDMFVGETYGISLVIDPSGEADLSSAFGLGQGRIELGTTKVSLRMEAELMGANFAIEPKGRVERELSLLNPTRWSWEVSPKSGGEWPLHLSLYVILVDELGKKISEENPLVETRTVLVSVRLLDRVAGFVKTVEPIRAFIFAVCTGLVGVLGWLGWRRVSRSRPARRRQS